MQWDNSENAGFTTGTPWFYVNENYKEVNVAAQETDEDSVLNFYREVIKLRKELSCVRHGNYKEYGKNSSTLYTYSREDEKEKILVVCSYTDHLVDWKVPSGFDMEKAEQIVGNYKEAPSYVMRPYETRVYRWEK